MEDFIHVFLRFVSRRGFPRLMISDNATNFTSAARVLQTWCNHQTMQGMLAENKCEWKFIPSRAPWFGGFYERLIGITKTALRKTFGRALVDDQELQTMICRVEMQMNDRPLTYVSNDLGEPSPLTPSMLLQGHRNDSVPEPIIDPETLDDPPVMERPLLTKRLLHKQRMLQQLWLRWHKEYLVTLRQQKNKKGSVVLPKIDDVVLIHDDGPRTLWQLGRVIELLPGPDDRVRVVRLRTSKGMLLRPVARLYPLEVSEYSPQDQGNEVPNVQPGSSERDDNASVADSMSNTLPDFVSRLVPQRRAARLAEQKIKRVLDSSPEGSV